MKKLSKLNKIGVVIFLTIHLPLIISLVIAIIEQTKLNNLQNNMYTKKQIKETFNKLSEKSYRKFKYKRCIINSKETILFEAYNNEIIVFNSFYDFKLLSYNKSTDISVFSCSHKNIEEIIKYNLK